MDKVITYSFGDNFIKKLAVFVKDNFCFQGNDFSRLAIVFGGKRPALFLKKELAQNLKQVFFAPRFFSMDEFAGFIASKKEPFAQISEIESCYLLYKLAGEKLPQLLKGRQSFAQFLPWGRELLSFLEQLDLEDIPLKTLENIQANASIGYEVPESINTLLEHVVLLRGAFNSILIQKKSYTRGLIYKIAAQNIEEAACEEFDKILFCNLFYLHHSEEKLIKNLYDRDKAILFFQKDGQDWSVFRKAEKVFSAKIEPHDLVKPNYNLKIYAGFDSHSQVCLAREILKNIKDIDKTVIVLPEPEAAVALLCEITQVASDFNVSIGYPLRRSSLYSLFELAFRAQGSRKEDKYYAKDYLKVISHPLIKNISFFAIEPAVTRILAHKIEEFIVGIEESALAGSLFVSLKELEGLEDLYQAAELALNKMDIDIKRQALQDIVREIHRLLFYSWEDIGNFYEFACVLEDSLNILIKYSFLASYPLNLAICDRLLELTSALKKSDFSKDKFDKEEVFKIFLNHLDTQRFSFSGSPLKGLQILGLLESRALSFENVIILDSNEQVLPRLNIYEPLIPRQVMLALGLNRLEKEDEIQRHQFMRLIGAAKNVHLIYDSGIEKEKSRFLEELIWNKEKEKKELEVIPVAKAAFTTHLQPAKQAISKNKEMLEFLRQRSYSASSVNTYLNCPLRFYYQYVLGLEEKESLLEDPEGADIGTFIHEFLELAFAPFKGKKPLIEENFKKYFNQLLEQRFAVEFARKMKSDSFLLKEIILLRMKNFLDAEAKRQVDKVVCLEEEGTSSLELSCGTFNFKYRIDRIDKMSDGTLLVIDYKTGGSDLKPSNFEKIKSKGFTRAAMKKTVKSFQLPLYYYFVGQRYGECPLNAAFYNLNNSNFSYLLKNEELSLGDKVVQVILGGLDALFSELLDPGVKFCPDEENTNYCAICPFFYLCR
jgi:ATP-dependent helicase/nuclease subunit B